MFLDIQCLIPTPRTNVQQIKSEKCQCSSSGSVSTSFWIGAWISLAIAFFPTFTSPYTYFTVHKVCHCLHKVCPTRSGICLSIRIVFRIVNYYSYGLSQSMHSALETYSIMLVIRLSFLDTAFDHLSNKVFCLYCVKATQELPWNTSHPVWLFDVRAANCGHGNP